MFACNLFGRQTGLLSKNQKTNKEAKAIEVVSMINQVRTMPRLGGKKSYHILMDDLKSMKIEEINI
jgi:hypothetical protein